MHVWRFEKLKHLKCFGSTFLLIQICSKLIFTTSNYQLEILCFSYDTPLHLLGFVSTEDDVVMDEKREKRKINCGTEKGNTKAKTTEQKVQQKF